MQEVTLLSHSARWRADLLKTVLQVQNWADLPHGVLAKVFSTISTADCWKARRVSQGWASQARQTASFEVAVIAKPSNLICKVKALYRRQLQQRLPHVVVVFRVATALLLNDLLTLLQALRGQRKYLSSFILEVWLFVSHETKVSQTDRHAKQIEHIASGLLTNYGIELSIKLCSTKSVTAVPPPTVLQSLAPFLISVNIHRDGGYSHQEATHSACTSAHIAALQHYSRKLSVLCISELDSLRQLPPSLQLATSIPDIAQLTSLHTLHLALDNCSHLAGFQPLGQLSSLKSLRLHCTPVSASCADVLESSRDTLSHVSLSSHSWSMETYSALHQIHSLDSLVLSLYVPSGPQVDALAGLTARFYRLDLHHIQSLPDQPLLNLSAANSAIYELWLYDIDDTCCRQLGSLQSLRSLVIVNSPLLTGTWFNIQPNVIKLVFMNCPGVNAAKQAHIRRTAMPACRGLPCSKRKAQSHTQPIHPCWGSLWKLVHMYCVVTAFVQICDCIDINKNRVGVQV